MEKKSTIAAIILVVLVILSGGWLLYEVFNNDSEQVTQTAPLPERNEVASTTPTTREIIVRHTASGFTPLRTIVKLGDTVTFINESDALMWVASDPHPTHTNYPAFDELTSVPAGGVYKFTFDKTGTWGFHNHMNSSQKGTIVVQ